jgi:hypothetical protein
MAGGCCPSKNARHRRFLRRHAPRQWYWLQLAAGAIVHNANQPRIQCLRQCCGFPVTCPPHYQQSLLLATSLVQPAQAAGSSSWQLSRASTVWQCSDLGTPLEPQGGGSHAAVKHSSRRGRTKACMPAGASSLRCKAASSPAHIHRLHNCALISTTTSPAFRRPPSSSAGTLAACPIDLISSPSGEVAPTSVNLQQGSKVTR